MNNLNHVLYHTHIIHLYLPTVHLHPAVNQKGDKPAKHVKSFRWFIAIALQIAKSSNVF